MSERRSDPDALRVVTHGLMSTVEAFSGRGFACRTASG